MRNRILSIRCVPSERKNIASFVTARRHLFPSFARSKVKTKSIFLDREREIVRAAYVA